MMEVGIDAPLQLVDGWSVPRQAWNLEKGGRILVEPRRHGTRNRTYFVRIVARHGVEDKPNADVVGVSSRCRRTDTDPGHGGSQVLRMSPDAQEYPVCHPCGHLDGFRTAGRDPHRDGPSMSEACGSHRAYVDILAREKTPHKQRGFLQFGDSGRSKPQPSHGGVADAIRQDCPAEGNLVECRDSTGRGGGMMKYRVVEE